MSTDGDVEQARRVVANLAKLRVGARAIVSEHQLKSDVIDETYEKDFPMTVNGEEIYAYVDVSKYRKLSQEQITTEHDVTNDGIIDYPVLLSEQQILVDGCWKCRQHTLNMPEYSETSRALAAIERVIRDSKGATTSVITRFKTRNVAEIVA